jgi:hypothetical protein
MALPIKQLGCIGHCNVFNFIHNNSDVAMSATTASGGNAGRVIAELALEDLERRISWRTNDLGEFPVGQSEADAHLGTVLTLQESCRWYKMTGRNAW